MSTAVDGSQVYIDIPGLPNRGYPSVETAVNRDEEHRLSTLISHFTGQMRRSNHHGATVARITGVYIGQPVMIAE